MPAQSNKDTTMQRLFRQFASKPEHVWQLFTHMNDGLIVTDQALRIVMINPSYEKITGYTFAEMHGKNPNHIASNQTKQSVYEDMWKSLENEGTWTGEVINRRKNGELFWSYLTITYIPGTNKEDSYYIGLIRDITERKEAERRVRYMAYHDDLTKMPNRMMFEEKVEASLKEAEQGRSSLALLFLDLDRFKKVNDSFGHQAGDTLLTEVARRLQSVVAPQNGLISRFGGDEFTVLLEHFDDKREVKAVVDDIFEAFQTPITLAGREVSITVSIGISFFPDHGRDFQSLMQNADQAMYQTKDEGRNNFHVYTPEDAKTTVDALELETDLIKAIEREELFLHYQPQFDVQSGDPTSLEAFVRWHHPERGLLSASDFIKLAETNGHIAQLDELTVKAACRQLRTWRNQGYAWTVSVNIAKQTFEASSFIDYVQEVLNHYNLPPEVLSLEINEHDTVEDIPWAAGRLRELQKLGVRLALDDFGSGYSSLSRLKDYPVDTLKIDRSFLQDSNGTDEHAEIIKLILHLAYRLGFHVVCGGLENQTQLSFLEREGCPAAQGYYYLPPKPPGELITWIEAESGRSRTGHNSYAVSEY